MASQAEIDLVVDASDTLPELQRDLTRVVRQAQRGVDRIDVDAALNVSDSLNNLNNQLNGVIRTASEGASDIDIDAVLAQQRSVAQLRNQLNQVIHAAQNQADADPVTLQAVLNSTQSLRQVSTSLRRVVRDAEVTAPDIELEADVHVDRDRLRRALSVLGTAGGLAGALGSVGAAAGLAVPALAGVVAATQQLVPAAAVATTGILAMGLASATLKLGLSGVGDAITAAFDPKTKPEELAKQIEGLAPPARDFVNEVIKLRPALDKLKLDVQGRLFKGLAAEVGPLAKRLLPQIRGALDDTADSFNAAAKGVVSAASELSANGTFGKALDGASKGIKNLTGLPALAVTAFGQLAAAASPAFDRITKSVARVAEGVSKDLSSAFKSGALEDAINNAIDSIAQLGRVAGNIFGGLSNIIGAVTVNGQGLFTTLETLSQAFEDVTGSAVFQEALRQLSATMADLVKTAAPLLVQALEIIAKVLIELGPPARKLIDALGPALGKVLTALGPPLIKLAELVGDVVVALTPFITLAGDLIAAILPSLTPLFQALVDVVTAATPTLEQLAQSLGEALVPILDALPQILEELLPPFVQLVQEVFPQLTQALIEATPGLVDLATSFSDLLVQLAPVIAALTLLATDVLAKIIPLISGPVISAIGALSDIMQGLSDVLELFVIPALKSVSDFLQGDFTGATENAQTVVSNLRSVVVDRITDLKNKALSALGQYASGLGQRAREGAANFINGLAKMATDAIAQLGQLLVRVRGAFANAPQLLFNAGVNIIQGLINGIRSKTGALIDAASDAASAVTNQVKGLLGIHSPSVVMEGFGDNVVQGFINGIVNALPALRDAVSLTMGSVPAFAGAGTLSAPSVSNSFQPNVFVSIGNESIRAIARTEAENVSQRNIRITAQGVRR